MLTAAEHARLEDMSLSFASKYLYAFILRRRALENRSLLSLGELCAAMTCTSPCAPWSPLPGELNALLHELHAGGLIATVPYAPQLNFDGRVIRLPYLEAAAAVLPGPPFAMHEHWQPSAAFAANALSSGLEDCSWDSGELRSFIGYWRTRPEQRTQAGWERAFAQRLLRRRTAAAPPSHRQAAAEAAACGAAEKPRF